MRQLSLFEAETYFHGLKINNNDVTINSDGKGKYLGKNIGVFNIKILENEKGEKFYSYRWDTETHGFSSAVKTAEELQLRFDRLIESAVKNSKEKMKICE